jgi:excisionase family DNA binding protein
MSTTQLITIQDLARQMNCGEHVIRDLVRKGRIPCVRLGHRTLRFDSEEVRKALAQPVVEAR